MLVAGSSPAAGYPFCVFLVSYLPVIIRGFSSNGRALALHARGKGIDTPNLQLFITKMSNNAVQLMSIFWLTMTGALAQW